MISLEFLEKVGIFEGLDNKQLAEIKNDLISNITHEFKTPITTISTALEGIENFSGLEDPEKLANDHILSWSNEGDTVLDPFMGSGTTGKMAKLNNRKFIGIELDEGYFNIAKDRINNT